MFRAAQQADWPALEELFVTAFGGPASFARSVLADFAGPENVFLAQGQAGPGALLCAVPVTLAGRPGAYYYGLTTAPALRGQGVMTGLMDYARRQLAQRGAAFAVLIPAGESLFGFYAARGFEKAFEKRVVRRAVRNNLWAQADFDTITANGLQTLRDRYAPRAVQLNQKGRVAVMTDLYSGGITTVCSPEGYGLYFKHQDRLRFIELFAEGDRAAEKLLEAARQKTGAEQAVVELGAQQNLFLGEGTAKNYGMIQFFGPRFDVQDAYMRLMLDDE